MVEPEIGGPPLVDPVRCSGCGRCVAVCTEGMYALEVSGYRKHAVRKKNSCERCLRCVEECPLHVIRIGRN